MSLSEVPTQLLYEELEKRFEVFFACGLSPRHGPVSNNTEDMATHGHISGVNPFTVLDGVGPGR